jgi:hypothetical protein
MTRKEQIAKKAAQAAALATYNAILNPPVWKVAGRSFKTSPTWEDIAKAAAAASYSAILKIAQEAPKSTVPDKGKLDPKEFGMIGLLKKEPKPVTPFHPNADKAKADDGDVGNAPVMEKVDDFNIFKFQNAAENPRLANAPQFANWLFGQYGKGPLPEDTQNFVSYVKNGGHGEDWAFAANWPRIVGEIGKQVQNPAAVQQLSGLMT